MWLIRMDLVGRYMGSVKSLNYVAYSLPSRERLMSNYMKSPIGLKNARFISLAVVMIVEENAASRYLQSNVLEKDPW